MKAFVRGPFRISDAQGEVRTPKGSKERGLLALLLLSPGQRRTRIWLQDKLWSDRNPEQGSVSLRQALTNIRKALGPLSERLQADRGALWLDPLVPVDLSGSDSDGEILQDLDVRDPEFGDWLRGVRLKAEAAASDHMQPAGVGLPVATLPRDDDWPVQALPRTPQRMAAPPAVAILQRKQATSNEGRFLMRALVDRLAAALHHSGDVMILIDEETIPGHPGIRPAAAIEVETLGEAESWYLLLRVIGQPGNRCVWTGRQRLPFSLGANWTSQPMQALINRAASAAVDLVSAAHRSTPYGAIQRAVRRIYDFDRHGLDAADLLLRGAEAGDASGLALAWRSFGNLTRAWEFREEAGKVWEEATHLSEESVARARGHPVILALAAQVQMTLNGDYDYGLHLAGDEENPYALDSLSLALQAQGAFEEGHMLAERARVSATGMPNSFSWDMQCCLTAIGIGQLEEARGLALSAHRKMPVYRPALRYLVALNLLVGAADEAAHYTTRLRQMEPDFTQRMLLQPSYPVETLRRLGLVEVLEQRLL
jgi:hypothetical protein